VTLLEGLANFIDRMVLFAELDNQVAGGRFLGLGLRAMAWGYKKDRVWLPAEVVAQDVKRIERVAEGAGDVFGGPPLDQISAQGLVLAVFGQAGFEEEAAEFTYLLQHVVSMGVLIATCGSAIFNLKYRAI